jgi:hemolysin D
MSLRLLRRAQNLLEQKVQASSAEGEVLQQSNSWMRATTWGLIGTAAFGVAWLALAQTEEVIVATGKLEPSARVQELQTPTGGVVSEILVTDGQRVRKGDVLIRMDTKTSSQQLKSLEQSIELKRNQLALKQQELVDYEMLSTTEQRVLKRNLDLQRQIEKKLESLARSGASSELQYLQQKDKVEQVNGQLAQSEIEQKRRQSEQRQVIQQLRSELSELTSRLVEIRVNRGYQQIVSPADGIVFDLKPKGTGYVAQASEPILKIVPFDKLVARVEIPSSDVGFVRIGQSADISIDSFPSTDYGVLEGSVKSIGSDALAPDAAKGRQVYAFPVQLQLKGQQLKIKTGQSLPLQIGMSLHANIKLRKVSYLNLLMGSFEDKASSLREINSNENQGQSQTAR